MAQALNTGSTLSFSGGQNRTSTAISTNIIIAVRNPLSGGGFTPVGAVQSMQISEKRGIKMIDEVGTDGHIDSVPNVSTNITGSCQRVRFDALRVAEAFSRGFVHVAAQAYPFDIIIFDTQRRDQGSQISTVIKNVWIEGIDYTYQVSDWVITDNMSWQAENIYSVLNAGSASNVATGGIIRIPFSNIDIERQTDVGANGRRGSLDAAGLIDLGDSGDLF